MESTAVSRSPIRFALPLIASLILVSAGHAASRTPFAYVSPQPGSTRVSPVNNIALRAGPELDARTVHAGLLQVHGSRSGAHEGRVRLSADRRTLLFEPLQPYATGETVTVELAAGLRTAAGAPVSGTTFSFEVAVVDPRTASRPASPSFASPSSDIGVLAAWPVPQTATADSSTDWLATLPPITTRLPFGPARDEAYLLAPFQFAPVPGTGNLVIVDGHGQPLYEAVYPLASFAADFKVQPGGRLSAWLEGPSHFIVMDSAYTVIDTFTVGNGYTTDVHELVLLPDGHALLMAYDPQPVAMDTVVAGGDPNATVIGLIIQELDEQKNVVFQWRSWDHFAITDAVVSPLATLTGSLVDYVHGNSIERALDGNLIISSRHLNEITKIDRNTGDVIWRMGRNAANNDFTFPNDPRGFSHQHDARILPNGHLTLFDNGNLLNPLYSRAVEYALDESTHVATMVWEHRHSPEIFAGAMGGMRRMADGSSVIGWGGNFGSAKLTDVDADGNVRTELQMPAPWVTYRAFRSPWRTSRFSIEPSSVVLQTTGQAAWDTATVTLRNTWDRPITFVSMGAPDSTVVGALADTTLPLTLAPGDSASIRLTYSGNPPEGLLRTRFYVAQQSDSEYVAQYVDVTGQYVPGLSVEHGAPHVLASRVSPNPAHARTRISYTLPTESDVRLDIFDVSGRRVAQWLEAHQSAGPHVVEGITAGFAPGLYHYRLRAGTRTAFGKWVVSR